MASFEWKEVACNKLHLPGPAVIRELSLLVPYSVPSGFSRSFFTGEFPGFPLSPKTNIKIFSVVI